MLYADGRGAESQVGQQLVSVRRHGDQITAFFLNPLDDLFRRLSIAEFGRRRDAGSFKLQELVNLTLAIAKINVWNRLNVAFRNVPGSYQPAKRAA